MFSMTTSCETKTANVKIQQVKYQKLDSSSPQPILGVFRIHTKEDSYRSRPSFVTIVRAANAPLPYSCFVLFASPCIMKPAHCEENIHKRTRTLALAPYFIRKNNRRLEAKWWASATSETRKSMQLL